MKRRKVTAPKTLGLALPYVQFDERSDLLWLKDASASITLRLTPKSCLSLVEQDFQNLRTGLTALLDQMPLGAFFQFWLLRRQATRATDQAFQNWKSLRSKTDPAMTPAQSTLQEARERLLEAAWGERAIYQTEAYLTLRIPADRQPKPQSKMGPLSFLRMLAPPKKENAEPPEPLERSMAALSAQVKTELETLGWEVEMLPVAERWRMLFQFFNPERTALPELSGQSRHLNLSDSLAKTDLIETRRGVQLGRTRLRIGTLKTYPDSSHPAMLEGLANENHEFDLVYTVLSLDPVKERERLSRKQRLATGMASGNRVRDLTAEAQLSDVEETLQAMGGGEKLLAASLHLICREPEGHERDTGFERLLAAGESIGTGCQWFEETVGALPVFFSVQPFAPTHLSRPKRILSSNLSDLLPVYGIGPGHREACVLFETPYQSNLGFSLYEKSPSANAIAIGSTGSGKSTLVCGLLLGMNAGAPEQAPSSFVIDVGNSFKRSVLYLGGSSLDLSPEQGLCINPFDLEEGEIRPGPEKVKFLTTLFNEILGEDGNLPKLERATLETEILLYYDEEKTRSLSGFKAHLERSDSPETRRFARLLSLWCRPHPYGLLFDGPTNVSLTAPHLHFELKGCQRYPDLLRAAMLIVMDLIWRELKRRYPKRSLVVVDEAHTIIRPSGDGQSNSSARWVEDCFRQMRKFSSAAVALSQTAKDLKNDEIGDGILANAPNRFILRQRGDEATLKADLKLNDQELSDVFSLAQVRGLYSEFYLHSETIRGVFRYRPTPHELWLSTTHPPDNALLTEIQTAHPDWSLSQLIDYLAERYPQGAEAGEVAV